VTSGRNDDDDDDGDDYSIHHCAWTGMAWWPSGQSVVVATQTVAVLNLARNAFT